MVESDDYKRFIKANISGAAQPQANAQVLTSFPLFLPPLPTQRKIAAILSAYDDLIENNTRRIRILEEMARLLYREWFVHFRLPGHEKVKMKNGVPEGWEVKTINDAALNFDSKRVPLSSMQRAEKQGPYPYYGAAKILDHIDGYIFDGKYLLVAEDGSVITPDNKPVLQMAYGKFWVNNHTHILRGKSPVSSEYLYLALSQVNISGYITGAAQPKITQANLNRIPILFPSDGVLHEFDQIIEPLMNLIETLGRKNANLRRTRDLLLPRLVSGEVDVSELEIKT